MVAGIGAPKRPPPIVGVKPKEGAGRGCCACWFMLFPCGACCVKEVLLLDAAFWFRSSIAMVVSLGVVKGILSDTNGASSIKVYRAKEV